MRFHSCRTSRFPRPRGLPASFLGLSSILYLPCQPLRHRCRFARACQPPRHRCRFACARSTPVVTVAGSTRAFQDDLSWDFQRSPLHRRRPRPDAVGTCRFPVARRRLLACVLPFCDRPVRRRCCQAALNAGITSVTFRPAPRLRLGAFVCVPPAPFLRPRRTVRGLPACCSWRQSWGSTRFSTAHFTPRLSPRRLTCSMLRLASKRPNVRGEGLHPRCDTGSRLASRTGSHPADLRRRERFVQVGSTFPCRAPALRSFSLRR